MPISFITSATTPKEKEGKMHRCGYCGMPGHKRPTCPKRSADLAIGSVAAPAATAAKSKGGGVKVPPAWKIAEAVIPHASRVLLYGPPGTGKTTAGNFTARGETTEVYNVTLTEEMPAAELRGHFVPKGGEFVWQDGPALQAYRNGGRLVLNEIDKGSADALIFCYALLDDPGISRITLPTGEHVRPHDGFTVVATTNGEPDDLPEALQDRFDVRIYIDKPHPNAMLSLPEDLREAAANAVAGSDESRVSFRSWKSYANLREHVGEEIAAKAVFGNRAKAIIDTMRIAKVRAYTPAEITTESEPESSDTVAGFRAGDLVRVDYPGDRHDGKQYYVAAAHAAMSLARYHELYGKILVSVKKGGDGKYCFEPGKLELVF